MCQEYKSDKKSVGKSLWRRTHSAASQLKRNAEWLCNLRQRGLINREEPLRFIVGGPHYQNNEKNTVRDFCED